MSNNLDNLKLSTNRSVSFQMMTYAVATKRTRPLRHRIYGCYNMGFRATPTSLTSNPSEVPMLETNDQPLSLEFNLRRFTAEREADTINFSAPFDKNEFASTDGLSGSFRVDERLGGVIGLGVIANQILVVQKFGLATLDPTFDPSGFNMSILAHTYKEIVPNTAKVLGDSVIFLTHGGMCRVKCGSEVTQRKQVELLDIDVEVTPSFNYQSGVFENRYFLKLENKTLVVEKFFDSWFFVNSMGGVSCVWESDEFSLGYAATRQFIKQIRLRTTNDVTIVAKTEIREQRLQVRGGEGVQRININLKGETFRLRIEATQPNTHITDLVAVIGFGRN